MRRPNTLVYRTMSKAYGLAALRIGYVIGQADAKRAVRFVGSTWLGPAM